MFDIGFWELIILFGLGLLVLGPERLPRVAIQLGNWAGQARRMARSLTSQIRDELDIDVHQPFRKPPPTYSRPGMDDLKPGGPGTTGHGGQADDEATDSSSDEKPAADKP